MTIVFSSDIDEGIRVEGYEPRIIKRYVAIALQGLETEVHDYFNYTIFINGRECSVWAENIGDYIYVEHIIFNIFRATK